MTSSDKLVSWAEDRQYSLVTGGMFYCLMTKIGIVRGDRRRLALRALLFAAVAWLPLAIVTLINGTFSGEGVQLSFIEDFAVHIRLLLVIPFFIWVETIVDPAFDTDMNQTRRLVPPDAEKRFERIVRTTDSLSNSWIPEIVFLIGIYALYLFSGESLQIEGSHWSGGMPGSGDEIAAGYYLLVAVPIYQLLTAHWLWRWIVWGYSVLRASFLPLRIDAAHADKMAGLGYMTLVPAAFSMVCLGFSLVFTAWIAEQILYGGSTLDGFYLPVGAFVVSIPLATHLPLLSFTPMMIREKVHAMSRYGSLLQYHNNLFRAKWLEGNLPDESSLGSLDNSSIADINSSYQQAIRDMQLFPFTRASIVYPILLLFLPFTPLVFTVYSLPELVSTLAQILGG